jgi:hypothetical protein
MSNPIDGGGAGSRAEDGGQQAQAGGFARAIDAQQPEDPARLATEIDAIDRPDLAALPVVIRLWSIAWPQS